MCIRLLGGGSFYDACFVFGQDFYLPHLAYLKSPLISSAFPVKSCDGMHSRDSLNCANVSIAVEPSALTIRACSV